MATMRHGRPFIDNPNDQKFSAGIAYLGIALNGLTFEAMATRIPVLVATKAGHDYDNPSAEAAVVRRFIKNATEIPANARRIGDQIRARIDGAEGLPAAIAFLDFERSVTSFQEGLVSFKKAIAYYPLPEAQNAAMSIIEAFEKMLGLYQDYIKYLEVAGPAKQGNPVPMPEECWNAEYILGDTLC